MPSKKVGLIAVLILILALCVGAIGYLVYKNRPPHVSPQHPGPIELIEITETDTPSYEIDFNVAKRERILGNPDAPIKISEHSSFTCGHCGNFHRTTYAQFKAEWLDTGRAYLVFSDFPLNAPALHASMVTRCAPEDRYFEFVEELFAKQNDWAYGPNYLDYLKQYASQYGMSHKDVDTCINNQDLQKSILDRLRATQVQFEINSTPSFVINNSKTITGALNYEAFNQSIENAVNPPTEEDNSE